MLAISIYITNFEVMNTTMLTEIDKESFTSEKTKELNTALLVVKSGKAAGFDDFPQNSLKILAN
jgi:hypothetical protein